MTFSLNVDSWIESVDYKMPAAAQRDLVLIDIVKYAQWLHDTCTDGTRPDASIEEQREYCVVSKLFDMPYTSSLLFTYIYVIYKDLWRTHAAKLIDEKGFSKVLQLDLAPGSNKIPPGLLQDFIIHKPYCYRNGQYPKMPRHLFHEGLGWYKVS